MMGKEKKSKLQRKRKKILKFEDIDWEKAQKLFRQDKNLLFLELKSVLNRYPYAKEILYLLAAGVSISAVLVAPGMARVLTPLVKEWSGYEKRYLRRTLKRLKKQKLVEVVEKGDEQIVRITKNGMVRALRYKLEEMKVKKPKRWDGRWRVAVFDIPEKKRRLRDVFRNKIKELELYPLQESVYICPYPCFDEIEFLRQIYGVGIHVRYMVVEKIEDDEDLKNYFGV